MHDIITIGLPLFAILAGILLNRSDVKELRFEMRFGFSQVDARIDRARDELRAEMRTGFSQVAAKIDHMRDDLRQFDRVIGQHDARIDNLASRVENIEKSDR
jgi:hypothetical protein